MSLKRKYIDDENSSNAKRLKYPSSQLLDDIADGKADVFLDYLCGFPRESHYLQIVKKLIYPVDLRLSMQHRGGGEEGCDSKSCLWMNPKGPKIDYECKKCCEDSSNYSQFLKTLLLPRCLSVYAEKCPDLLKALKNYLCNVTESNEGPETSKKITASFEQLAYHQPDIIFAYLTLQSCLKKESKTKDIIKHVDLEGTYSKEKYSTVIKIRLNSISLHVCGTCVSVILENCLQLMVTINLKESDYEIVLSQTNVDVTPADAIAFLSV